MSSTIHFYEVDGGPSGIWWEGHQNDLDTYLGAWDTQDDMMNAARMFSRLGHTIRFHTQAEYELEILLEDQYA